jgi:L-seryl-tRNA(Ser) seleniumtransferase
LVAALWECDPRIAVGVVGEESIALNPQTVEPGEDAVVVREVRRLLS